MTWLNDDYDTLWKRDRLAILAEEGKGQGARYTFIEADLADPTAVNAALTSSVFANTKMPFSERQGVDHPLQFHTVTKRTNELMAHSYPHLFSLPAAGLCFFTAYGSWVRPDMALEAAASYKPPNPISDGVAWFVEWCLEFHGQPKGTAQ